MANGRDAFLLTAGVNLPIYHKRLDSSVRSVEAKAVSTAREYDSLRQTVAELEHEVGGFTGTSAEPIPEPDGGLQPLPQP